MAPANRLTNVTNTQVALSSVILLGILLFVMAFAYGEIASGEKTKAAGVYTLGATIAGAALLAALFLLPRLRWFVYAGSLVFGLEAVLAAAAAVVDKRHHIATAADNIDHADYVNRFRDRFAFHPMLAGRPTPGFSSDSYNHTADGMRYTAAPADPGAPAVVAVGGSTTYEGAGDHRTWPSLLAERANLRMINMGVLGYSTAEHVVQTAFWVPQYQPVCAIYYVGWNDLRSVGVNNLQPDYGGFHLERQGMMLGVYPNSFKYHRPSTLEYSAIIAAYTDWRRRDLERFLTRTFPWWKDTADAGTVTDATDPKALQYFTRNMETIIAINRMHGIRTILIPQVMWLDDTGAPESGEAQPAARPWTPFLAKTAKRQVLADYHKALASLAAPDVLYLDAVLAADWNGGHFIDEGHFTPDGSSLFADTIASSVARFCRA